MLVLSRKIGERIRIGDQVVLTVVRVHGDKVRLGIDAPADVAIHREEVYRRLHEADGAGPLDPAAGPAAQAPAAGPPDRAPEVDASLPGGCPGR